MGINKEKILNAAQKHQSKKNWDKAVREYRKLVEDDPNDVRSRLKMADCLVKGNSHDEALAAYVEVANYYLRDGIYDKSVAIFKQALRLATQDPELHRSLGEAYHRLGRLKEANRSLHQAQKIYRDRGEVHAQRQILEQMVRIDPEDYGLRIQLAERYAKDGMNQQAIELFEYAGRILEEEGRTDEYLQVAERILYLDKTNVQIRRRVIELHMDAKSYERALKHLQVAFKADENNVEILSMLALAFERLGKTDKAIMVHADLANRYYRRQDLQRSLQSWEDIARIKPNHTDAQKWIAHLRRKLLEDSGSIPGLANTGNLGGDPLRQSTQPNRQQQQQPQRQDVMADVEFLDDDLGLELAPAQAQRVPAQQQGGMPYRGTPQPAQQQPHRGTPQQPQQQQSGMPYRGTPQPAQHPHRGNSLDNQLADLAAEQLDDINFNQLQSYPASQQPQQQQGGMPYRGTPQPAQQPSAMPYRGTPAQEPEEILDIEFIPEVAEIDDSETIKQHLNETRVFLKYGLYDKAIQSLMDLTTQFPTNVEIREELAGVYIKRGPKVMAADQFLELAKLVRENKPRAKDYLNKALEHINDPALVHAVANELGIALGGVSKPVQHDTLVEASDIDALDSAFANMLGGNQHTSDDIQSVELNDDDLIELADEDLLLEEESIANENNPNLEWAADNVDAMFDDLFQEVDASGIRASAMGRSSISGLGDMGNLDDIIERGLAQEQARDGLNADESPSMQRGRLQLNNMSMSGINIDDSFNPSQSNPFGQQSLSGSFSPGLGEYSLPQQSSVNGTGPGLVNAGAIMNTNYELGAAYMEMGLVEEAFDEFRQAAEDPEITDNAHYSMALCEYKLGRHDSARGRLQHLLGKPGLNGQIQQASHALLAKL